MSQSDLIQLVIAIVTCAGLAFGLITFFVGQSEKKEERLQDRNKEIQSELQRSHDSKVKDAIMALVKEIDNLQKVQAHISMVMEKQHTASMKSVQDLQIAVIETKKDLLSNIETTKMQFNFMTEKLQNLYQSIVKEIAPDVFRVSEKKKP